MSKSYIAGNDVAAQFYYFTLNPKSANHDCSRQQILATSLLIFEKNKVGYFVRMVCWHMRIVCWQNIMPYLFLKFKIVVCCKGVVLFKRRELSLKAICEKVKFSNCECCNNLSVNEWEYILVIQKHI